MTQYRILERLNELQEWEPAGIAYMQGEQCFLFLRGFSLPQTVHISALEEGHLPKDKTTTFRWAKNIKFWDKSDPFDPETALSFTSEATLTIEDGIVYVSLEDVPREYRSSVIAFLEGNLRIQSLRQYIDRVMRDFVASYNDDCPPLPQFVEVLWRYWTYETKKPPLPYEEHNVALLLYARAYGFPVEDYPQQIDYLNKHKSHYASLALAPTQWGARASLSKEIVATLDAPVMNVWVLKNKDHIERVIITGKGLPQYQEKVFSDALITAMRVQASNRDFSNVGLIDIQWEQNLTNPLDIQLPVLGDNAPLADRETAEDALGELIKQLRDLSNKTGFVQIHETDATVAKSLERTFFKKLAHDAIIDNKPILWAPNPDMMSSSQELVVIVPVFALKQRGSSRKLRGLQLTLELPLHLLVTEAWEKLFNAYSEHLIRRIEIDAHIRLAFYNKRATTLQAEKEQWDTADEVMRQQRWGPTVTLNQRFDDATGLTIWLQPPEIIPTKGYYEENVPSLIDGYKRWATKMQNILDSLIEASSRPDAPFRRFITTRLFDAVIRERSINFGATKIQKLYSQWSVPVADLLWFLWRKKLSSLGKPEDLFSPHTTFQIRFTPNNDERTAITQIHMDPYIFLDVKRSIVLLDPERGFMTIKNALDYPKEVTTESKTENILDIVLKHAQRDESHLAELLRQKLMNNPQKASGQILELLRPQVPDEILIKGSNRIYDLRATGLENAKFPRLIYLAESAMINRALLTSRQALEEAQIVIPNLLKKWRQSLEKASEERPAPSLNTLPDRNELECRLYLLMTIAECLATDHLVKDFLPSIYRTPQTGKRAEIYEALASADNADPDYTSEWIEALSRWDLKIAYNKLIRDLPSEEHLLSLQEHSATQLFEAIELVHIAGELRKATVALSYIQETRASALVKLAPAIEHAILSNAAGIVRGELEYLLELLTGRQVGFSRDRS